MAIGSSTRARVPERQINRMFKSFGERPKRNGANYVIDWSAAAYLLAAFAGVPVNAAPAQPTQFAQVVIREQILIRVPARIHGVTGAPPKPIDWKESRGPKCIPMSLIAGASLLSQNSFDLILKNRARLRAKLEKSCPALDYYYGFYIRRTADGQVCADRDAIRSRMGGECQIDRFRLLTAKKAD